ncbi:hypothetical protein SDD30_16960 [Moorella naiadis]|uniref:recombination directionality factor n=1 Tax=Moorella naiadis (nom. illeg.) TaxID=3093670 RepID=UPI003D9C911B
MIKGWTDSVRIPRLGTIALGVKDEKGVPKAVDYFVVPPEVQEVYGPQPRELDIVLPSEDIESIFPAYLKRYGNQYGLICRGDGEYASVNETYAKTSGTEYGLKVENGVIVDMATGEVVPVEKSGGQGWVQIPCPYKNCQHYINKKCREVAVFSALLPKVPGVLGAYSIDTGSFNSYQNIKNSLLILKAMAGRISFIPLKLKVRMQEVHPNVGEKQIKRAVPIMYVDMGDITLERMLQLARERKLLTTVTLLPEPAAVDEDVEPYDENAKPELLYEPEASPGTKPAAFGARGQGEYFEKTGNQEVVAVEVQPEREPEAEPPAVSFTPAATPVTTPTVEEKPQAEPAEKSTISGVFEISSPVTVKNFKTGPVTMCRVTNEDGEQYMLTAYPGSEAEKVLANAVPGQKYEITDATIKKNNIGAKTMRLIEVETEIDAAVSEEDFGFDDLF